MVSQKELANAIRFLSIDAVEKAQSGHPGMPMGMADVATVLFQKHLNFVASDPKWPTRDRFVLSAGHGSMLHYALLYLTGCKGVELDDIKSFRKIGSKTAGHPEYGHIAGVETTTGPLGQGVATSVGIALAERMLNARFGDHYKYHTYVIAGDGCLMEGISQEAISMAGHWKLDNLILMFDDNSISIDGDTSISVSEDTDMRFQSAGWHVLHADAHDHDAIDKAISEAKSLSGKPVMIRCTSTIGFGSPNKGGTEGIHGAALGTDEVKATRDNLNWPHEPFHIPADILAEWRAIGKNGDSNYESWTKDHNNLDTDTKNKWADQFDNKVDLTAMLTSYKQKSHDDLVNVATRKSSQLFLDELVKAVPNLIGGSADLTHSNLTHAKGMTSISSDDFSGNYIHYGVREHGMGSVLNGLLLSGGFKAYGGTFFVFTDFCRPSIRLSALMGLPVVYVMTHDSIGLGEDGPTHQPVEHLASFRAMPNLLVMRPADVLESAECWAIAIQETSRPSILVLSRQGLPCLEGTDLKSNNSAKGGYLVRSPDNRKLSIIATGSEVKLALDVAAQLSKDGIEAAVVSMPCDRLFDEMDEEYRKSVLGDAPVFAIEAASDFSWYKYVGAHSDRIFGVRTFGVSAPIADAYKSFGLETDTIANKIKNII